jgi:hypothetical protein
MNSKKIIHDLYRKNRTLGLAGVAAAIMLGASIINCPAQALPPGVQDVVKLSQAGISDDIILSQIKNSQATYNLTADQIISLKNLGVSQAVIKALISGSAAATAVPAPTPPPAMTPPAPAPAPVPIPDSAPAVTTSDPAAPAVSLASFQTQLAPDGTWIDVPGIGLCWQPTIAITDPFWRPYCDHGYWTYTDAGWCWQSDYTWGNIVFHYGRWTRFNDRWVWVPGYDWAPAWVCWREADGYCGWAPLPPGAVYKAGIGLYYNGNVALDVDFGLGVDAFTFVAYDHFWDHDFRPFLLPHDRLVVVFHGSHVLNGYRFDHGHFFVEGLGHDHIALVTHHDIRVEHDFHDPHYDRGGFDPRAHHDDWHDDRHDHFGR